MAIQLVTSPTKAREFEQDLLPIRHDVSLRDRTRNADDRRNKNKLAATAQNALQTGMTRTSGSRRPPNIPPAEITTASESAIVSASAETKNAAKSGAFGSLNSLRIVTFGGAIFTAMSPERVA